MPVETLIEKSCLSIDEGPHWDERNGTLLYVDINDGSVHRWDSKTRVDEKYKFGNYHLVFIFCSDWMFFMHQWGPFFCYIP